MGTLLESLKAPPRVDAAPLDSIPFGLTGYKLQTLPINLPQAGSGPLRVPVPAPEVSGRPVAAYASAEPQGQQGQEGFKDRWPQSSFVSSLFGAPEWFAQNNKGQIPNEPTVLYGDTAAQQPMSYASAEPG